MTISSCAPITEAQKFERYKKGAYDAENWALCETLYDYYGKPTIHMEHEHAERDKIYPWMIKSDLAVNRCRALIKRDYWASD